MWILFYYGPKLTPPVTLTRVKYTTRTDSHIR